MNRHRMAVLMLGALAVAASLLSVARADDGVITLCTGADSGVYYDAGKEISAVSGKAISIKVVETVGTMDNLERALDMPADNPEACDAIIGQPDGPTYLARKNPGKVKPLRAVGDLHREYLHVLCNKKSGVDDLGDIADGKTSLYIGDVGSGGWLIWQNILAEDDSYSGVPVINEGGNLALSAMASGESPACMLVPAGLKNGTVANADSTYGDSLILADADDKDFNDAVDITGKPLYSYDYEIPSGTYPVNFQTGFFGSAVETISWTAKVYVNTERVSRKELEKFVDAVGRASSSIKAKYGK